MNRESSRRIDQMLKFIKLLRENIREERRPSFYAERLNISTIYLNEIVKEITEHSSLTKSWPSGPFLTYKLRVTTDPFFNNSIAFCYSPLYSILSPIKSQNKTPNLTLKTGSKIGHFSFKSMIVRLY